MFCPRCASEQSDELKFCKACGANLEAVRQVIDSRETAGKIDWSRTWVADMFLSPAEKKRRDEEIERQRGITPEIKRTAEIKAGVITSSVGVAVAAFLYVLMQGIILSGNVTAGQAEILSRLWAAGVIPLLVGFALIINGTFVSKRLTGIQGGHTGSDRPGLQTGDSTIESFGNSPELPGRGFSVTEQTTKHLGNAEDFKRGQD